MIKRILPLMLVFFTILSVSGVYATWRYAEFGATPVQTNVSLSLSVFDYPPTEILPGGEMQEAELGKNHFGLIELILWEDDKDYGLNINKNALIHQYLKSNRVVYSNQKISGGNMKFILDPKNNTHGLYYCIEKTSNTEYLCYTFEIDDLATAAGTSHEIPVYRTTLAKTDLWEATTSYLGYAQVKRLTDLGESADPNTIAYSVDVDTWHV